MQRYAVAPAEPRCFGERRYDASLIVRHKDRADRRAWQRAIERCQVEPSGSVDSYPYRLPALARAEYRRMLDRRDDHPAPFRGKAPDGQEVGLGSAAREDDLPGGASERRGAPLSRRIDQSAGVLAWLVDRRRIGEDAFQSRHHRAQDRRMKGGRGVGVEIGHAAYISETSGTPGPGRTWKARRNAPATSSCTAEGGRSVRGSRAPAIAPCPPALPPSGAQSSRTSRPALMRRSVRRSARKSSP